MIFSIRVILHKEKMGKQIDETKIARSHYPKIQDSLVLSIDKNEKITKFNEKCERILGYRKNEVINRYVTDFFIPTRYLDQWNYIFENSKINRQIDNLKIPFLTKSGQEIIISWSNFPVKNENGEVIDIGLVGNITTQTEESNETLFEYPKYESDKINIEKLTVKEKIKVDNYLTKVFRKMKSENEDLLVKNKDLENRLKDYEEHIEQFKIQPDEHKTHDSYQKKDMDSFSKLFIGKKKRQEFENVAHELDKRKKDLDDFESELLKEKNEINEKINDFIIWREKLELLNDKLEEKWNELEKRESLLVEQPAFTTNLDNVKSKSKELYDDHQIFDKIQDSAAIIQRGILRHANISFSNLIGYNIDEIIDKSLFDFIVPEGFLNIERFYLSRLKGEDVSTYETVILTKDNNKISIEVINKPTFFKGEKAEIAIFKILKKDDKK